MTNTNNGDLPDDELDKIQVSSKPSKPSAAKPDGTAGGDAATTPASNIQSWDMDTDDGVAAQILRRSGIEYVKVSEGNPVRARLVHNLLPLFHLNNDLSPLLKNRLPK